MSSEKWDGGEWCGIYDKVEWTEKNDPYNWPQLVWEYLIIVVMLFFLVLQLRKCLANYGQLLGDLLYRNGSSYWMLWYVFLSFFLY